MNTFNEFVDKKTRESRKQLKIIEKILRRHKMPVGSFLEEEDPYLFLKNHQGQASFEGVRIYKIGGALAYRIQKESQTHPYGKAYALDIEGMWDDLISDETKEDKAGGEIIKAVKEEFQNFFAKSLEAEKELRQGDFDKKSDPMGNVMTTGGQGTDYSNMVFSKMG